MIIGLHDADKDPYAQRRKRRTSKAAFPNYALMKISAYHKGRGDTVEWWDPMLTERFDKIYSSKVFDFTEENPYLPDWAIRGGTGYTDIPLGGYMTMNEKRKEW